MELSNSILADVRVAIGLSSEPSLFDTDLLMHINTALAKLNQNGVGNHMIANRETTWEDFRDSEQTEGNLYFHMVPQFVNLSTKILFDPPPPSSVEFYSKSIDESLWRLKIAYEK